MSREHEIANEWSTALIVDERHGLLERVISAPPELTGMMPAMKYFMSNQALIRNSGRLEGNRGIFPLKIGEFHGPAIPSIRFLIIREVKVVGDTVKLVEEGIGGVKSVLRMWHSNATKVEVEKTRVGNDEVHTYTTYYPVLQRVVIGLDDTDTSTKGDTYLTALLIGRSIEADGYAQYVKQTVTINYPRNPFKTTNNASSAMVFHVQPSQKAALIQTVIDRVQAQSNSRDTGVAILEGLEIPSRLQTYTRRCKSRMLQVTDTEKVADAIGARLISFDGDRGKIGALSSLGYVNDPYQAISPSFKFRMLMKLGNMYVKMRDAFA